MENCPDDPDMAALAGSVLVGLDNGPLAVGLYDADQQLRYANAIYRATFLPGHTGPISFTGMLRYGFEHGCGIKIDDGNLERILATVAERWRQQPAKVTFESDLIDGRWHWVTESWLPNGWLLSMASDITPLKRNEKSLRQAHEQALQASRTDALTGLPNRRHMVESAQFALDECRAAKLPLSIAMIDLDHFKDINDRHGHMIGDKVLSHFAQTCQHRLRGQDQIGRLGGEEFLLLLPGAGLAAALNVVKRMHQKFPSARVDPQLPDLHYTFSAGLAEAASGDDLDNLIRRADCALYQAKTQGRNRIFG